MQIHYWRKTEQTESTSYLQQVSHDSFEVVDHKNTGAELFVTVNILLNSWSTEHHSHNLFLFKHLEKLGAEMLCLRCASHSVTIPKK